MNRTPLTLPLLAKALISIIMVSLLSVDAHAQTKEKTPVTSISPFPATYVPSIAFAFDDFKKTHKNYSCFSTWVYEDHGHLYVLFAVNDAESNQDELSFPLAGMTRCGRAIRYQFKSDGTFIGKTGLR